MTRNESNNILGFVDRYHEYMTKGEGMEHIPLTLDELNTNIVTTHGIKEGNEGEIIDIKCPERGHISIVSKILTSDIFSPNMSKHHKLRLKLTNDQDREIDLLTRITITKESIGKDFELLTNTYYTNVNLYKPKEDYTNVNLYKSKEDCTFKASFEWYQFKNNIYLDEGDHIKIYVTKPNIDIDIIKLALDIDMYLDKNYAFKYKEEI